MSTPTITPLPPAPNPTASPATFDSDTTNFIGAMPTMVSQINAATTFVAEKAVAADLSATAASQAAQTANTRATAAAQAVAEAQAARNTAQAAAAAAQSSAGLPAIAGKPGYYLAVTPDGKGVHWIQQSIQGVEVELYDTAGTYTFTKSGTDRFYVVRVWGDGGGGGRGATYGGGGGGGGYVELILPASAVSSTVTVKVGAGGLGATTSAHGVAGEGSSFGEYAVAPGGNRGRNDQRFAAPAGAKSDNAPTSAEMVFLYGSPSGYGAPSPSYTGGDAVHGGAGGGAASSGTGTNGGVSQFGGNGGKGASGTGAGSDGLAPGGGGGGSRVGGGRAGNGAPGRVEVYRIKG